MTMLTPTQVNNWDDLSSEQRAYFTKLAANDPDRSGRQFFEDTIPQELQDDPKGVDLYLNGGTVTVPVDTYERGRASTGIDTRTVEIEDRDWSHDVSTANGGSDSADNGRFESASTNRSRGADNSTAAEQAAADEASALDAELIDNRVDNEVLIDRAATGLTAGSLIADAAEFAVDGILPIAMGLTAATRIADAGYDKRIAIGGGIGTALLVLTPPGQLVAGGYLTYKLIRFGGRAVRKLATA